MCISLFNPAKTTILREKKLDHMRPRNIFNISLNSRAIILFKICIYNILINNIHIVGKY